MIVFKPEIKSLIKYPNTLTVLVYILSEIYNNSQENTDRFVYLFFNKMKTDLPLSDLEIRDSLTMLCENKILISNETQIGYRINLIDTQICDIQNKTENKLVNESVINKNLLLGISNKINVNNFIGTGFPPNVILELTDNDKKKYFESIKENLNNYGFWQESICLKQKIEFAELEEKINIFLDKILITEEYLQGLTNLKRYFANQIIKRKKDKQNESTEPNNRIARF